MNKYCKRATGENVGRSANLVKQDDLKCWLIKDELQKRGLLTDSWGTFELDYNFNPRYAGPTFYCGVTGICKSGDITEGNYNMGKINNPYYLDINEGSTAEAWLTDRGSDGYVDMLINKAPNDLNSVFKKPDTAKYTNNQNIHI